MIKTMEEMRNYDTECKMAVRMEELIWQLLEWDAPSIMLVLSLALYHLQQLERIFVSYVFSVYMEVVCLFPSSPVLNNHTDYYINYKVFGL